MSSPTQAARFPSINAYRAAAGRRIQRWAKRRQGGDRIVTLLAGGRIYILPTAVGLVFGLMAFTMLLGSMNYNNNLSFVLTFLLVGIGFVSMHQCQRNLVGLEIAFAGVDPVFAGETAVFRIAVTNHSRSRRPHLQIFADGARSRINDLEAGESRIFYLEIPAGQRGRLKLDRFGVRTLFPFELFRAWAWLHMDISAIVYPRPAEQAPLPPQTRTSQGHRQHDARGEEDFAGLRTYHEGDSPRHVAWKAYARTGELLSKQFAGADTSSQWFEYEQLCALDVESRLSVLTRWIVDADRTRRDYGLRVPGEEFSPAHGERHRHKCLESLAFFDTSKASP